MRFVLVEPSHPGNIGATARAMRAMGLAHLLLVQPRFAGVAAHPEAIAYSSGATSVLQTSREVDSLEVALDGVSLAIAVSAAGRAFGPAHAHPPQAVALALAELAAHPSHQVAFVFGCERTGLSVEHVQRCQALLSIPSDPAFSSLNLSQAVQVVAWELRRVFAVDGGQPVPSPDEVLSACAPALDAGHDDVAVNTQDADDPRAIAMGRRLRRDAAPGRLANAQEIESLFAHLERALVEVRFLDPAHPKKLMPRMRRLFGRTRLEAEEVELLRGVCTQMIDAACRTGAFLGERERASDPAPVHAPSAGLPRQA